MKYNKHNRYSVLAMLAHVCTDINQGALPALLPFLVLHKGMSYTSAAGLVFASNSMSSFIQPFFGYLGDKVSWPWLMGLGAFLAGSGIALVGFFDNYWAIFTAVAISGIGVALFHPEGGRMANLAAGKNKGAGIALFSVGGNIGFALGPIIASVALTFWGLKGTLVFLIPAVIMAAMIWLSLGKLKQISAQSKQKRSTHKKESQHKDDWSSFFKVAACLTSRSVVAYGLTTFIPLYFAAIMFFSESSASMTLTLYSVAAAAATLLGGQLADRFGFHNVIRGGFVLLAPLMVIFPFLTSPYLAIFLLVPIAIGANAPQGATIALGQKFLPNHLGTSSGIMFGLAVSIGGMVTPGIGWVGDHYGLDSAMIVVAVFAVLTLGLAFLIPKGSKQIIATLTTVNEDAA